MLFCMVDRFFLELTEKAVIDLLKSTLGPVLAGHRPAEFSTNPNETSEQANRDLKDYS